MNGLTPADIDRFRRSWIPEDIVREAGIERVDSHEGGRLVGRNGAGNYAGVVFPYLWPGVQGARSHRLRRDAPDIELLNGKEKEVGKYLSAPGQSNRLYFFPRTDPSLLQDQTLSIVVTEGEKKTLALHALAVFEAEQQRFLPIGLSGVWNWRGTVGKTSGPNGERRDLKGPIPDLDLINWKDRRVVILFDANVRTNLKVRQARTDLAKELRRRRARVLFAEVPDLEGVNGVDDWLAHSGPHAVLREIESASEHGKASVPPGFELNETGVYFRRERSGDTPTLQFVCGPLLVTAAARNRDNEEWSTVLQWPDDDGQQHTWVMPNENLGGDHSEVKRRLLAGGLRVSSAKGCGENLVAYISQSRPADVVRCVSRIGWYERSFVLPDETIAPIGGEQVVYRNELALDHSFRVAGTVEDWQREVSNFATGNSRLVFSISAAFAGPLLRLLSESGGGFHLRGTSSVGKSTALLVAGSVWGGGGKEGFTRSWRATANGLEAVGPIHNDGFLALDELSQIDPREAAHAAYSLANGLPKARMTRLAALRSGQEWSVLFLSSGEMTLADHLASIGQRTRGGQEVRMIDIPADAGKKKGLFEDLHGLATPAALAEHLRGAALKFYGAASRAWIRELVENLDTLTSECKALRKEIRDEMSVPGNHSEVQRAAARFAMVGAAGELATQLGVTGWADGEARAASVRCFGDYLSDRGSLGSHDQLRAIAQTRACIEAHGDSRFQKEDPNPKGKGKSNPTINRIGFMGVHERVTEYRFLPESFRSEVCKHLNPQSVLSSLRECGYLRCGDGKNLTVKNSWDVPGLGRPRVYAVSSRILDDEE